MLTGGGMSGGGIELGLITRPLLFKFCEPPWRERPTQENGRIFCASDSASGARWASR